MKTKSIFLSLAILLVAVFLLSPAYAQEGTKAMKSVKIGVISPLSGPLLS